MLKLNLRQSHLSVIFLFVLAQKSLNHFHSKCFSSLYRASGSRLQPLSPFFANLNILSGFDFFSLHKCIMGFKMRLSDLTNRKCNMHIYLYTHISPRYICTYISAHVKSKSQSIRIKCKVVSVLLCITVSPITVI